MAQYQATYKCQLCGTLIYYEEPQEREYDTLRDQVQQAIKKQIVNGNQHLLQYPMHICHACPGGHVGVAYFVGFHKA